MEKFRADYLLPLIPTYPISRDRRHQRTFTTDSGLLAFGEHSAYLQLMEMERLLPSIPASTAFKPFHLTVSTRVWFGISDIFMSLSISRSLSLLGPAGHRGLEWQERFVSSISVWSFLPRHRVRCSAIVRSTEVVAGCNQCWILFSLSHRASCDVQDLFWRSAQLSSIFRRPQLPAGSLCVITYPISTQ